MGLRIEQAFPVGVPQHVLTIYVYGLPKYNPLQTSKLYGVHTYIFKHTYIRTCMPTPLAQPWRPITLGASTLIGDVRGSLGAHSRPGSGCVRGAMARIAPRGCRGKHLRRGSGSNCGCCGCRGCDGSGCKGCSASIVFQRI